MELSEITRETVMDWAKMYSPIGFQSPVADDVAKRIGFGVLAVSMGLNPGISWIGKGPGKLQG